MKMKTPTNVKQEIRHLIDNRQTTMFVTHDQQGGLVSRPMTTQQPERDGDVWFFVSSDADMLDEVQANPEVNVAYTGEDGYASLSGNAQIVDDVDKKKELWYDELAKWFDGQGPESPDVKLIKFSTETARYWGTSKKGAPKEEIVTY